MQASSTRLGAALVVALLGAGCAQGPADLIAETSTLPATTEPQAVVRTATEREQLERDLDAMASRQSNAGQTAVDTLPSAMALSVIRQQQEEEARSLLEAATAVEPAPAAPAAPAAAAAPVPCDPAADPLCVPTVE
jgi:hypothetical protein